MILGYLQIALEKQGKTRADRPLVLELFCMDGYYSAHAKKMGAGLVTGVDIDKSRLNQARVAFNILFEYAGDFQWADVLTRAPNEAYDSVICCGGLYHLHDPAALVAKCRREFSRRFRIVHSVVSLENTRADYFEAPAPGWNHGSRFSRGYLEATIQSAGFRILDSHERELEPMSDYAIVALNSMPL